MKGKPKWLKKVKKLWRKGKVRDVIEFLEKYYREHPDDTGALKFLLDVLLAAGMSERVVELVGESPVRFENGAVMQCFLEALKNIGERDRVLGEAKKFFEVKKDDVSGYYTLSYAYMLLDMYDEALRVIDEGLKHFPDSADLWIAKADALMHMKHYENALEALKKASKLRQTPYAELVRAHILIRLKRYREAADILTDLLLSGFPLRYLDLWYLFRVSLLVIHPIALRYVGEVMYALRPNDYRSLWALAYSLIARKKFKKALAIIDVAIRLKPDHPELYADKAMILRLMRRKKEALMVLEEAVRRFPDDEELLGSLGETCLKMGDLGCVRRVLRHFEERGLTNTLNYLALKGDFLVRLGRKSEAIEAYKRARQFVSRDNIAYSGIIERLRKLGVKVDDADS